MSHAKGPRFPGDRRLWRQHLGQGFVSQPADQAAQQWRSTARGAPEVLSPWGKQPDFAPQPAQMRKAVPPREQRPHQGHDWHTHPKRLAGGEPAAPSSRVKSEIGLHGPSLRLCRLTIIDLAAPAERRVCLQLAQLRIISALRNGNGEHQYREPKGSMPPALPNAVTDGRNPHRNRQGSGSQGDMGAGQRQSREPPDYSP